MGGLLDTGTTYRNQALSGFLRRSAEQEEIDKTNRELQAAEKMQTMTMTAQLGAVGFLLSKLF